MKKLASLSLAALLLFALAAQVSADVIWEPMDDFYQAHREECTRVEYRYEAQKDTPAYITPEEPGAKDAVIPAGTVMFINYLWQDGAWGATSAWEIPNVPDGDCWVQLADFRRLYWKSDFLEDHRAEIRDQTGEVSAAEKSRLWTYPGSGTSYEIGGSDGFSDEIGYYQVYTDEEGREWGRVSYYYGHRDEWICISDPQNPDLPATAPKYAAEDAPAGDPQPSLGLNAAPPASETDPLAATEAATRLAEQGSKRLLLPVIGLVVLVVAVTAALLFLLRRRAWREKE